MLGLPQPGSRQPAGWAAAPAEAPGSETTGFLPVPRGAPGSPQGATSKPPHPRAQRRPSGTHQQENTCKHKATPPAAPQLRHEHGDKGLRNRDPQPTVLASHRGCKTAAKMLESTVQHSWEPRGCPSCSGDAGQQHSGPGRKADDCTHHVPPAQRQMGRDPPASAAGPEPTLRHPQASLPGAVDSRALHSEGGFERDRTARCQHARARPHAPPALTDQGKGARGEPVPTPDTAPGQHQPPAPHTHASQPRHHVPASSQRRWTPRRHC